MTDLESFNSRYSTAYIQKCILLFEMREIERAKENPIGIYSNQGRSECFYKK